MGTGAVLDGGEAVGSHGGEYFGEATATWALFFWTITTSLLPLYPYLSISYEKRR